MVHVRIFRTAPDLCFVFLFVSLSYIQLPTSACLHCEVVGSQDLWVFSQIETERLWGRNIAAANRIFL